MMTIKSRAQHRDLIMPIVLLITCFIIGVAWFGGYYIFGGPNSFLQAVQKNTQTPLILCAASLITGGSQHRTYTF